MLSDTTSQILSDHDSIMIMKCYQILRTLNELHGTQFLSSSTPSEVELLSVLETHPDRMILIASKAAAATINRIAVNNLFPDMYPCGEVCFENAETLQPIYPGTRVIVTQN